MAGPDRLNLEQRFHQFLDGHDRVEWARLVPDHSRRLSRVWREVRALTALSDAIISESGSRHLLVQAIIPPRMRAGLGESLRAAGAVGASEIDAARSLNPALADMMEAHSTKDPEKLALLESLKPASRGELVDRIQPLAQLPFAWRVDSVGKGPDYYLETDFLTREKARLIEAGIDIRDINHPVRLVVSSHY